MPDNVFNVGKETQIFTDFEVEDMFLPKISLPTFNIIVDSKSTIEEFNVDSLLFWITKSRSALLNWSKVITDIHIIFHAVSRQY